MTGRGQILNILYILLLGLAGRGGYTGKTFSVQLESKTCLVFKLSKHHNSLVFNLIRVQVYTGSQMIAGHQCVNPACSLDQNDSFIQAYSRQHSSCSLDLPEKALCLQNQFT